jgi:Chalcone isomerase-like
MVAHVTAIVIVATMVQYGRPRTWVPDRLATSAGRWQHRPPDCSPTEPRCDMDRKPDRGVDVVVAAWRRSVLIFGMFVVLGAGDAAAKVCLGINFPDQAQINGSALTLNGLGVRKATLLKIDVYVAALYVANPSSDPNAILGSNSPMKLILHFVRDVGAGDISNGFDEGFARSAKAQLSALQERIATLEGWMTDLTTGQRMTFIFRPGTGVQVDVNGTVKGTINGDDFAKAFLSIWLGNPPNPEIKAGLLGGACA